MDPITLGIIVAVGLIVLMAIGTPIAFALGGVSLLALLYDRGLPELTYFGETFFDRIAEFGFVAIPMFILMGAAVASFQPGAIFTARSTCGWVVYLEALPSPISGPAPFSPRSRALPRPPAPPLVKWASLKCALVATPTAWRRAVLQQAAHWGF